MSISKQSTGRSICRVGILFLYLLIVFVLTGTPRWDVLTLWQICMLKLEPFGHWTVTLQGVLLAWTKHFKVRGVQDTDVVSSLRKALQKHKASFVPAGGEPDWPQIVFLGDQLLVCGLFLELSDILQGLPFTNAQHGFICSRSVSALKVKLCKGLYLRLPWSV